ncbi:MAG TPA: polysaccharide deacetylase family protein [Acidimicrobiales bacterium]|nr:polysaccharide deacetylase family protein [Acidimicrobiales bacterium]
MTKTESSSSRRPAALATGTLAGAALAYFVPSVLVLPTFWTDPPESLPGRLCRWRASTTRPEVGLTFDDGPSTDTERTLDVLDELDMRATFFVLGTQMRSHPDTVVEIAARGHEVACHGFEHRHHLYSSPRAIRSDLAAAVQVHRDVLGRPPRFYRPTYGQLCAATLVEARRHRMEVVLWSRWGKEFAESDPEPVLRRLEPGLVPGAILLLHDNDVSCRAGTGDLTRTVLRPLGRSLAEKGLRSVTLDQLLPLPTG